MRQLGIWPRPAIVLSSRGGDPPFPLGRPGTVLSARARQLLLHGLLALGVQRGDEALVPAYHHGSEVQALVAAGLRCSPYETGEDLQPDPDDLEGLVGPRTRVLHLIHYLGFPQDSARWRRWCDERGLLLVEDAAQAWLADVDGVPVGSHGDLSVFCLYKSVGLPDGAAACGRVPLPEPDLPGVRGERFLAAALRRAMMPPRGPVRDPGRYDHAADIAVPALSRGPSQVTVRLLPAVDGPGAALGRRRSYERLLSELGDLVPDAFLELPAGASPFVFPIAVSDKAAVLAALAHDGIDALDLWSRAHPGIPVVDGGTSARLRRAVIGLPVHQDLGEDDLVRLARAARGAVRALVGPAPSS